MNRRQRRASGQRQQRRITGADLKRAVACPDCTADLEPVEVEPGRFQIHVYHDQTCPWLRQLERDGGHGIRIITHTTGETTP